MSSPTHQSDNGVSVVAPAQACWYKGESKISDCPRFWHSTANGVCTLVIPTCAAKDGGEYTLVLENTLGVAECSCSLVVFGKSSTTKLKKLKQNFLLCFS